MIDRPDACPQCGIKDEYWRKALKAGKSAGMNCGHEWHLGHSVTIVFPARLHVMGVLDALKDRDWLPDHTEEARECMKAALSQQTPEEDT